MDENITQSDFCIPLFHFYPNLIVLMPNMSRNPYDTYRTFVGAMINLNIFVQKKNNFCGFQNVHKYYIYKRKIQNTRTPPRHRDNYIWKNWRTRAQRTWSKGFAITHCRIVKMYKMWAYWNSRQTKQTKMSHIFTPW